MHQTILTQRQLTARRRIVERLTALVNHLELDQELVQTLQPTGIRDHAVADMIQLEGIAGVLDAIAENAGAPAPTVTDVTVNEFIAPPETYMGPEGGPVQADLTAVDPDGPETFVPARSGRVVRQADQAEELETIPDKPVKRTSRTSKSSKKK